MVSPFAKGGSFRFQPFVSGGSKTLQRENYQTYIHTLGKEGKLSTSKVANGRGICQFPGGYLTHPYKCCFCWGVFLGRCSFSWLNLLIDSCWQRCCVVAFQFVVDLGEKMQMQLREKGVPQTGNEPLEVRIFVRRGFVQTIVSIFQRERERISPFPMLISV